MQLFLLSLFCEHYAFLKKEGLLKTSEKKALKERSLYSISVPLNLFISFSDVFNALLTYINLKDAFLNVDFVLLTKNKQKINIKNLPLFWMND